jgi:uncharacterized membrane protein YhaH (DUF805 family)
MSLTDRIIGFLKAKSKRERTFFWVLVLSLFLAIALLAHIEGVGWQQCHCDTFGGQVVWDLNPAIWAPYGASGSFRVNVDVINDPYGRTLPPQQYTTLYFLTFLYWILSSLVLSKTLTLLSRRVIEHKAENIGKKA